MALNCCWNDFPLSAAVGWDLKNQWCHEGSGTMECCWTIFRLKGMFCHYVLILLIIWLSTVQDVVGFQRPLFTSELAESPSNEFYPIEISPAVLPHYPFPGEPLPPMYPTFPHTYEPVLTGKCSVNFSAMSSIVEKTASDCSQTLAALVGNVICCPQLSSFLHIFQGFYGLNSDMLVLHSETANNCFTDIISILASRGANITVPTICSVKSSNLTGGSCPVKDISTFEKKVNATKLLNACSTVDPLKECCRPICQPAILDAALRLSGEQLEINENQKLVAEPNHVDTLSDCKGVVYSYLSRKLSPDAANTAFRILSACKVNKVCPLDFKRPSQVIKACRNVAASNTTSCCSSLNTYMEGVQNQMLITNKQAIMCATLFGSMLRKGGITTNIYELCDVDLKDFSVQEAYGEQGCLLRSLYSDLVLDSITGFSFTCDLTDNIAAPWPLSSTMSSFSLCAPEMSLPALPTSDNIENFGYRGHDLDFWIPIFSLLVFNALLY